MQSSCEYQPIKRIYTHGAINSDTIPTQVEHSLIFNSDRDFTKLQVQSQDFSLLSQYKILMPERHTVWLVTGVVTQ